MKLLLTALLLASCHQAMAQLTEKGKCTTYAIGITDGDMMKTMGEPKEKGRRSAKAHLGIDNSYTKQFHMIYDQAYDTGFAGNMDKKFKKVPAYELLDKIAEDCVETGKFAAKPKPVQASGAMQ